MSPSPTASSTPSAAAAAATTVLFNSGSGENTAPATSSSSSASPSAAARAPAAPPSTEEVTSTISSTKCSMICLSRIIDTLQPVISSPSIDALLDSIMACSFECSQIRYFSNPTPASSRGGMLLSLDTKIKDDHNLPDRLSVYESVLIEPVHVTLVVKGQLDQFSLRWVSMHQKQQWSPPIQWEMQNDGIQLRPIAWPSFDCPSVVVLLDTLLSLELSFSESTYMMSLLGMSGQHTTEYIADTFMLRGYTFNCVFDRGKSIIHQFILVVVLSVVHLDCAVNGLDQLQLPWPSLAGQNFAFNCMSSRIIQWEIAWPSFRHEAVIKCRSVGTLFGISGWYFQHWLSLLLLSEYCVGEAAINSSMWMIVIVDSSDNTLLDNICGWYYVVLKKRMQITIAVIPVGSVQLIQDHLLYTLVMFPGLLFMVKQCWAFPASIVGLLVVKHVQTDATMALQQSLSWDPGGYSYWASEVTNSALFRALLITQSMILVFCWEVSSCEAQEEDAALVIIVLHMFSTRSSVSVPSTVSASAWYATFSTLHLILWDPGGGPYYLDEYISLDCSHDLDNCVSRLTSLWLHWKDVVPWYWKCGDSVGRDFKLKIKKELIVIVIY